MYCCLCGKEVSFNRINELEYYYETLTCYPDCINPINGKIIPDLKIVYRRWIARTQLLKEKITSDVVVYNPMTGEKIESFKKYVFKHIT